MAILTGFPPSYTVTSYGTCFTNEVRITTKIVDKDVKLKHPVDKEWSGERKAMRNQWLALAKKNKVQFKRISIPLVRCIWPSL